MIERMAGAVGIPQFFLMALIAGLTVGVLAGYYGAFVVQRRLSFLGNGLAHAAFGGVALGILLNIAPLLVAVPFTIAVALGIVWLQERTRLGADTAIGIFFSVSMALGVLFLSQTKRFTTDAFAYLFGSILAVTVLDLWVMAGMVLLSLATLPVWGRWAYATFDRELAGADRVHTLRDDCLLAVCLAATTVVCMKVVGIVLIASFLVIPPAIARLVSRTFRGMTLLAMIIGAATALAGLYVAYWGDFPPGAAIILVQAALFVVAVFAQRRI